MQSQTNTDREPEVKVPVPAVLKITISSMVYISKQEEKNHLLSKKISSLKDVISKQELNEHSFRDNESRIKFYTGLLSFATLMIIFELDFLYMPRFHCAFSKFQQFLMILMKLRLNFADQDMHERCFSLKEMCGLF